ncbi:cyclase family protein [Fulvivirga sp.]|uniref:cyclase family protein n=1 Tax=Fulvivirga sp. TaxID=1931237 RepID=UPI0032EABF78
MKIEISHQRQKFQADLNEPIDISIPIKNGAENPNCYYASDVEFKTIKSGDFVGSVALGGSVNYKEVRLTPHGNGTHTESYGHLSADMLANVNTLLSSFHFIAELITLDISQSGEDQVLVFEDYLKKRKFQTDAVIIRSSPNDKNKLTRKYSGTNPAYLNHRIAEKLKKEKVKHLLIDLPSLDKEVDGGALLAHRAFWNMSERIRGGCTVTELIYVDDGIKDGLYLLNLQVLNMEIDASPSRPILYNLKPL